MSVQSIIEKVCKWRGVFAGWQLGTRSIDDPECQAVRDHREVTIMLRAEVNALTALMVEKGLFTSQEFTACLGRECEFLDKVYEQRFPGFSTSIDGVHVKMPEAGETTKGWRP